MKTYLLLTACLILVGCGQPEQNQREVLAKLEAIESELANKQPSPLRWAFANKREIESAVFQWSRDKMESAKQAEGLSPEIETKIRQYEALQTELMHKQMESHRTTLRMPPPPPSLTSPQTTPARSVAQETAASYAEMLALSNRVAEAKAPVAEIVERRRQQSAQYRAQFTTDQLIAEYAKDRFELVVDASENRFSPTVLYRTTGEALDITEGVLKLFRQKTGK